LGTQHFEILISIFVKIRGEPNQDFLHTDITTINIGINEYQIYICQITDIFMIHISRLFT